MISTNLPNSKDFSSKRPLLNENMVIWATTEAGYFYPEHKTPYLFISNFQNKGKYVFNQRHIEVSDKYFYFLNANDDLEIHFSEAASLQTLFILFADRFIQECFTYFTATAETLIDIPDIISNNEILLPGVPFEFSINMKQKTNQLREQHLQKEGLDNILFEVLIELSGLAAITQKAINRINATKKSTKEELYRRLFLARDLMNDRVFEKLSLEQMAREVCLNKFHFLSCFKALYQTTPHQYFRTLKLEKALNLLQGNQYTVSEVCYLLGFESVGSFSHLFKKKYGISPSVCLHVKFPIFNKHPE
jgi:AraC-like DNA-binding protein